MSCHSTLFSVSSRLFRRRIRPLSDPGITLGVTAHFMGKRGSATRESAQRAMRFAFALIMPFSLLSGLATPIANMPAPLRYFTLVNPLRYAIDLAERVYLEGAGLALLWPDIWPLALSAALALGAASWMFRHRLQ